jgi:hypothetical protein
MVNLYRVHTGTYFHESDLHVKTNMLIIKEDSKRQEPRYNDR